MRFAVGASIVVLLALPCAALAQGTQDQQQACTPDVFRLCGSEIPNVDNIVACLNRSGPQLSPECHEVMFPRRASADGAPGSTAAPHRIIKRHIKRHAKRENI